MKAARHKHTILCVTRNAIKNGEAQKQFTTCNAWVIWRTFVFTMVYGVSGIRRKHAVYCPIFTVNSVYALRLLTFDHDALRGMVLRVEKKRKKRDLLRKRRSEGAGVLRKASEHSIPLVNATCATVSTLEYDF